MEDIQFALQVNIVITLVLHIKTVWVSRSRAARSLDR